jgi:molecular chaperone DnaK (HSP70)
MNYVKPNINTHTYILGIDFGHGETSADICNIQWNDNFLQLKQPESIEIFNGVDTIKSVLLIEQNGDNETHYIGQQAVSRYSNPKYHSGQSKFSYYAGFKKVPSSMNEEERNVMRIYMKEVYLQIRRQRPELSDSNHLVYIACPSNPTVWKEEELVKYADIALEAGIPLARIDNQSVGIIRESRAAFIKARSNPESKSSVKEGILLIDFGSSTVDLTYYSSKFTEKPIDDGYNCGASNVEYYISQDFSEKYPDVAKSIQIVNTAKTAIHLTIRDIKEEFYTYDSEDMEVILNLTKITNGLIKGSPEYYYSNEEINAILSSYIKSIRNSFIDYREKYLQDKPIELIFMTGGASRMNFIQDIARDVFNYKKNFFREINPSLTISNGIALAGRADLRTYAMENDLLTSDVIKNADIASSTVDKTASAIAERVISETESCYFSFASRSYNDNLGSLESDVKRKVDSIYASSYLTSSYNDVLKDVANNKIIPTINNIVRDYFPDFEIESIKSSSSFSLSVKSDSISTLSSVISSSLNKIEEGLIEGLGKLVWNIGIGGIAVAEGVAANIGIGIVNLFRDKPIKYVDVGDFVDEVTFSFRDKNTKLSSSRRSDVKNEFVKNKSTYKSSIRSDVRYKLNSDSSLTNQINDRGRDEIKKYISNQIQKARIMLN